MSSPSTSLVVTLLLLLLAVLAPLVVMAILKGAALLHTARLARDAAAKSLKDKFIATLLDLVDDFSQAQALALAADIRAAAADGKVDKLELVEIARKEWVRIKAYFTPGYLLAVAKALGVPLEAVAELAVKAIASKLKFQADVASLPRLGSGTVSFNQASAK